MKIHRGWVSVCIIFLFSAISLRAQERTLDLDSLVEGTLAAGQSHRYQLVAPELTLLSIHVKSLEGSLDPVLQVFNSDGTEIIANDDYAYPDQLDAVIQAIVIPRSDTYTLSVSGFGETSGAYSIQVLPGFDALRLRDDALSPDNWEVLYGVADLARVAEGQLQVNMEGLDLSATLVAKRFPSETDYYFEVEFARISSSAPDGQIGLVFRYQRPESHTRLMLSQRGFWRVDRIDEGEIVAVRDWSTHPAIAAGQSDLRLGILASGQHFDVVYNGQVVGSFADPFTQASGGVGIAMHTSDVFGSRLSFAVSEALMTVPTRSAGGLIVPTRLLAQGPPALASALARLQLIPAGGQFRLTLPESTVRHSSVGVTPFLLGGGVSYGEFALGARLTAQLSDDANGGCGLIFNHADDSRYSLAYATADGDYGVSRREGDGFEPGIYGKLANDDLDGRELLLIAHGANLHYFLDGAHVGSMPYQASAGRVGIAVVNYQEVLTDCLIEDLWVRSWDD